MTTTKQSNHISNLVQQASALLPQVAELQALYTEALVLGYVTRHPQTGVIAANFPVEAFAGDNGHLDNAALARGYQGLAALNDAIVANGGAVLGQILTLKR